MQRTFFLWISFLFLIGCSSKEVSPSYLLPKEKMTLLATDLMLNETHIQQIPLSEDTIRKMIAQQYVLVGKKYGLSPEQVIQNINWYSNHPDQYAKVIEKSIEQLQVMSEGKKN